MPPFKEWTKIRANSTDEAADKVIDLLEGGLGNVIYFHGWDGLGNLTYFDSWGALGHVIYFHAWVGLGASSVLRAVAKKLRPSSSSSTGRAKTKMMKGSRWDRIIHVDCSVWESKRALQKAIAQELELPQSVMAMFDQHEEDDDFNGVEQSARGAIPDVTQAILSILANCTFLVIFHNGSSSGYIDLLECGVPVIFGTLRKSVLWTYRSWFRTDAEQETNMGPSDGAIVAFPAEEEDDDNFLRMLLHEEAEEVARCTGVPQSAGMTPELVKKCIMYQFLLRQQLREDYTIYWGTHAANYCVCSGIIKTSDGTSTSSGHSWSAWEIAQALCNNLTLEILSNVSAIIDYQQVRLEVPRDFVDDDDDQYAQVRLQTALQVPRDFVDGLPFSWTCAAAGNYKVDATTAGSNGESLETRMFQHSSADSLRVLHLSKCTFSFASPPFLCCSSLRFLLLDHCNDSTLMMTMDTTTTTAEDSRACFRKLWVLDISYTDWYWLLSVEALQLMVELRELNVKGVKHYQLCRDDNNSSSGVGSSTKPPGLLKLVNLRVTTDPTKQDDQHEPVLFQQQDQIATTLIFPNLSRCGLILKTIILEGCVELKRIGRRVLPPALESFSFSSSSSDNAQVSAKIESISFQGCAQLKSVLLRGLFQSLVELDMSGTSVKTVDFRAMRGHWPLKKLFLLGCVELCAILWPKEDPYKNPHLEVLHIDTTCAKLGQAAGSSSPPADIKWYISLRDGRLLRSLDDLDCSSGRPRIEISSPGSVASDEVGEIISKSSVIGRAEQQPAAADDNKLYADVNLEVQHLQLHANWMWPCEFEPEGSTSHYISLQDDERIRSRSLQQLHLPRAICERASSLHVHDSLSVTSIIMARKWVLSHLKWCRVERCPNIEGVVFTPPASDDVRIFYSLKIFWASQLAKARYIWKWNRLRSDRGPRQGSFDDLQVLRLDCCPRLIHVLPIYYKENLRACGRLETLEIVSCGDLRDAFPPLDIGNQEELLLLPREFPELRRIHLQDLPSLRSICGHKMVAPKLETVKIRGCWGLTRLPAIAHGSTHKPKVECEKDWWDALQWDGKEAGHDPSFYDPTHSRYYKNKNLPRGSLIR